MQESLQEDQLGGYYSPASAVGPNLRSAALTKPKIKLGDKNEDLEGDLHCNNSGIGP
jgi:hypothetical protein